MQIHIDQVGNERSPVIVIDAAWPTPLALIDAATNKSDYSARSLYYPGLRSSAPPEYAIAITEALSPVIRDTFGIAAKLTITDSTFSLVATPSEKLVPFQRVPHFDSVDRDRYAVLHYLCDADKGGTSFYRHRRTGIESVTPENRDTYMRAVNLEVKEFGMPPARFIEGDTPQFERIAAYECRFNRILVYRGRNLHSVNTPPSFIPTADPRNGRLTVNTFLLAEPPQGSIQ
jgi:hypothetical protein